MMRSKSDEKNPSQRKHGLLLSCLLALTLAGGLAARNIGAAPQPASPAGGGALFSSASAGPVHVSARLDRGSVLRGGDGLLKFELMLRAEQLLDNASLRVPTDLIVVLDQSGSMQGAPLQQATAAVHELVSGMDASDRFSLVTYSSNAEVAVPIAPVTPEARVRWEQALSSLHARGGTNMSRGLDLASAMAEKERVAGRALRVILLSDGLANQGDPSFEGLRARAARAISGEYVLSAVGIGSGFDEHLMSTLADAGTGNFYYVRGGEALGGVFAGEFAAARETVASSLLVQIDARSGFEVLDAAGYPLERQGLEGMAGVYAFRPGALFSGQERRVWLTLAAPTTAEGEFSLGKIRLNYRHAGADYELSFGDELRVACVASQAEFFADVDADVWAESVLVDDYNVLRQKVSRSIQAGEREAALETIGEYRDSKKSFNRHMQRKDVAAQLDSLDELSDQVRGAFAASPAEVNSLGKSLSAEGLDGRRIGAKK